MNKSNFPEVSELVARKPGAALRAASRFLPGVGEVSDQIEPYTKWWNQQNREAVDRLNTGSSDSALVVIGDSAALGVGASEPAKGYAYQCKEYLAASTESPWEVVVLAESGAKLSLGLRKFLPQLATIEETWSQRLAVVCCLGSNDIFWSLATRTLHQRLAKMVDALPAGSVLGTLAGGSPRAFAANRHLRKQAAERGLQVVEPWRVGSATSNPLKRVAADKFHPNDYGYELMAGAFNEALAVSQ